MTYDPQIINFTSLFEQKVIVGLLKCAKPVEQLSSL